MARIRTIKPEFWQHEALSSMPAETHMLAAALLNYADDEGYFNANPRLVKAACFPLREPSVSVQDSIKHLVEADYIELGEGPDGRIYGRVVNFLEHQRINRPTESKISGLEIIWGGSQTTHPQLTESSPPERKGTGKGSGTGNREHETREREIENEFHEAFWIAYPNKVGKPDALKAFRAARKKAALTEIMDGLRRYIHGKPADRQWCNPATWLRQERWADEPASPVNGTGPPKTRTEEATQRLLERHGVFDERTDTIRNG